MNYCIEYGKFCELSNVYGYCQVTACSKYLQENQKTFSNQTISIDTIILLQTIRDIKFYNSKELIKWVEDQQKINKDPDYGIGNWC